MIEKPLWKEAQLERNPSPTQALVCLEILIINHITIFFSLSFINYYICCLLLVLNFRILCRQACMNDEFIETISWR